MKFRSNGQPIAATALAVLVPVAALSPAAQARAGSEPVCFQEQAKLVAADGSSEAWFGTSVSVSGDTAIVGASRDDELGMDAGAAYVYVRDGAGWTLQTKLLAPDGAAADRFGQSVAIRGDTALVGAQGDGDQGPYTGSAYVFVRAGTSWTLEAKLTASDAGGGDLFGAAVSLDGDTALVGAYGDDDNGSLSGSAYVFVRTAGTWTEQTKLIAPDGVADDWFGYAVDISAYTALVGAPKDDDLGGNSGSAHVFVRTGGSWTHAQKLDASDGTNLDHFGWSISLEGDSAVVGAYGTGDTGDYSGAAYAFERDAGTWSEQQKVLPDTPAIDDFFGQSVALSSDILVVGANGDDDAGLDAGSMFVFRRDGASWIQEARYLASDGEPGDFFGHAVALDAGVAVVAAVQEDEVAVDAGAAYVFELPGPAGTVYCTCPVGPCGNPDPQAGCASSTGTGALLTGIGATQPDGVTLLVEGARPAQFAIFFQGDNAIAIPFGGGFRCAGGTVMRITSPPIQTDVNGTAGFGPCLGDPTISSITGVVPGSGVTKRYQFWYRDPGGSCGTNFNLSNGYEIVW